MKTALMNGLRSLAAPLHLAPSTTTGRFHGSLFRKIAGATPDLLYVYDFEEHRVVYVNDRTMHMLGRTPEEILDMRDGSILALLHPGDAGDRRDPQLLYDELPEGKAREFEIRMRHADGTYRWMQGRGVVFSRTPEGRAKQTLGLVRDITDQKNISLAVKDSQELLAATIDALSAHIAMIDQRATIIAVNQAWRSFARANGFKFEHYGVGMNYIDVCTVARGQGADHARLAAQKIGSVLTGEKPSAYLEYECHGPYEERWFQMRVQPFRYRGELQAVIAHENVTELKRAEQALARHHDQLMQTVTEQSSELEQTSQALQQSAHMAALGTLSAGLGHDIGNLLLPLRNRLESLRSKEIAKEVQDDLDVMRESAKYLQQLSQGLRLLALDPTSTGAEPVTRLDDWWKGIEPFLKHAVPRHVKITHRIHETVTQVRMPRHLLTQAIFNLVHNAGKAMREKGDLVVIWAEPASKPRFVRVGVTDNGPGMTEEVRQHCLEPFFTTQPQGEQTGLGLTLVRVIVQRAGGSMEVHSELGKGTTMVLFLPSSAGHA